MPPVSVLPRDLWHELSQYLEEPELCRLRIAGVKQVLLMQKGSKYFKLTRTCDYGNLADWKWPIKPTHMEHLIDIHIDLGYYKDRRVHSPPAGYSVSSLPKTLVKAKLAFIGAPDIFAVNFNYSAPENIRLLNERLPNLTDLSLRGSTTRDLWTLPSGIKSFQADGLHWSNSAPFPPELETLDCHSAFWPTETINDLPQTLKTLRLFHRGMSDLPHLPNLTRLYTTQCDFVGSKFPPTLLELHVDCKCHMRPHSVRAGIAWPPFLHTLTHPHLTQTSSFPPSMTKWCMPTEVNDEMPGFITADISTLSDASKKLQSIALKPSWKPEPTLFEHLPLHLTTLSMTHTYIAYDQYKLLPITLTTLYVPTLNQHNIAHIARLTNLKDFGAYGGLISAATIRRLPRRIEALQFHGVSIDTKTQARWTRKIRKHNADAGIATETPQMDLQVFNEKTLPPALTKLIVVHHYAHNYYWTHTYEIYKDLPTSLRELHLSFWIESNYGTSPAFIRLCDAETQACDIFSRLFNLEHLSFHYPASANANIGDNALMPPFPAFGRLRTLCFHFAGNLPDDIMDALPPSLCSYHIGGRQGGRTETRGASRDVLTRYRSMPYYQYSPSSWARVFGPIAEPSTD